MTWVQLARALTGSRAKLWTWWGLSLLILLLASVFIIMAVFNNVGWIFAGSQGSSMSPTLNPGDLLISRPRKATQVSLGDVLVFRYEGRLIAHRLIDFLPVGPGNVGAQRAFLITQGDALSESDPPIPADSLLGEVVLILPGFGWVALHARALAIAFLGLYSAWAALAVWRLTNWDKRAAGTGPGPPGLSAGQRP